MLKVYNTKIRKEDNFKPLKQDEVKVYFCGPTVYNYAHIGNLRTFVFEDVVIKTLKFLGYNVKTTMNITDVDDKTIKSSILAGETLKSFTEKYTEIFLKDIEKLNITKADNIVPVTTLMPEMVRMINTMLKRGVAYIGEDNSIYYNIKKYSKYGKFANIDFSGQKESVRIDNDEYDKENASDFVLWKAWKPEDGDNFWEESFFLKEEEMVIIKGRPGWHIECSACNMKYFGPQIDIHMGGVDLIFPHHQNEIAQSEACTRKEFSKYWLHTGHLMVDGKKMAKSLNNFYTLKDLEEKFLNSNISLKNLYRAIRYSFINCKYRDSIDFSFSKLDQIFNTLKSIDETFKNIAIYRRKIETKNSKVPISRDFREYIQDVIQGYADRLEDDFNIPEAMAIFFDFQKYVNIGLRDENFSLMEIDAIIDMYKTFDFVLGIMDFSILEAKDEEISQEILDLLDSRNNAKKNKDFTLADNLRLEIENLGYKIVDSRDGSFLEKI